MMTRDQIRAARDYIRRENRKFPSDGMVALPREQWPKGYPPNALAIYRSHDFLVQVFQERDAIVRLSINRTDINRDGMWLDGITWDQLQWCKSQCGYGNFDAVEAYPPDKDVVNVANIRHLWVFTEAREPFFWRLGQGSGLKTGQLAEEITNTQLKP